MIDQCRFTLGAVLLVCSLGAAVRADEFDEPNVSMNQRKWDVGLDGGIVNFNRIGDYSNTVANDAFSLEEFSEEFEENNLPLPLAASATGITRTVNTYSAGGHVYYRFLPFLSLGLEGAYIVSRDAQVVQVPSIYNQSQLFSFTGKSSFGYAVPCLKLGMWLGFLQPYGVVGMGWYHSSQSQTLTITDTIANDDPLQPSVGVASQDNDYVGNNIGGGLDVAVGHGGSIGADIRWHHLYAPNGGISFLQPSIRCSYSF